MAIALTVRMDRSGSGTYLFVRDMSQIFFYERHFGADISMWDVSSVRDMNSMFLEASVFICDLSKWDVSSVTTMYRMFFGAVILNTEISKSP